MTVTNLILISPKILDLSKKIRADSLMLDGYVDNPIDLSRRCDSVETRKTPSPYCSSVNDSPTSNSYGASQNRSDTPTNPYQLQFLHRFRDQSYMGNKRETPSPPEHNSSSYMHPTGDDISPYILHAVALQQKLHNIPTPMPTSAPSSPESPSGKYPLIVGRDGKLARPFKAYPSDALSIASMATSDTVSTERFSMFRKQMLKQIHAANGGQPTITNPKMRRTSATKNYIDNMSMQPEESQAEIEFHRQQQQKELQMDEQNQSNCQSDSSTGCGSTNKGSLTKDNAYYERRRKNNAAAKKSRDRRRIKEDEIAIRAAFLERENIELRIELAAAKRQLEKFMDK